jgi:ATPase subunit of ABC transporter with duplicated ATPase domains
MMLAGGAASAGGAMINSNQQQQAQQAQNKADQQAAAQANEARVQEAARQKQMEQQQSEQVAKALTEANPADALVQAQQEVAAPTNEIATPAYNEATVSPVENKVVDAASASHRQESQSRTKGQLDAMALLSALDTQMGQTGDAIGRSGSQISTIGQHRRGSLNANAAETAIQPAAVTPGDSILGDVLMLGGQALGAYGGGRLGAGTKGVPKLLSGIGAPKHPSRLVLASGGLY